VKTFTRRESLSALRAVQALFTRKGLRSLHECTFDKIQEFNLEASREMAYRVAARGIATERRKFDALKRKWARREANLVECLMRQERELARVHQQLAMTRIVTCCEPVESDSICPPLKDDLS